ncbi:E3 ubiquitin-protein ligase TRIM8-like isoform X2 [Carcharodon carcharias]|uniref:E3 ubiquitin-protein ligase TRIM8-like isoform X2 n=1 Tax=Carcharodon carcharias TaxID=13397 RepID=UPI001B7DD8DA|nr:E3 ubiquitin-protein ligase TRIM8-like isoform X2 [Carcharodon carcharias]
MLCDIVEKNKCSQAPADFSHIMCDYCIENPTPAAKTCLKCEASFCDLHLQPHLLKKTFSGHTLIEPMADLTSWQCLDHKEFLQFYCEKDAVCVCGYCITMGKHKSHLLLSLGQMQGAIKNSMQLLSRVTETETVTGPDVPVLALNLSNISQLIQKRLNGWEKCHSDILEIIMPAYTEYRGPRKVTLFPTQLLWGSPYPTEHPPAVDRDQESRSIPREKVIEPGSKDSKLQLGSV